MSSSSTSRNLPLLAPGPGPPPPPDLIPSDSMLAAQARSRKPRGQGVVSRQACKTCRKRKSKCSGTHPCVQCIANKRHCVFDEKKDIISKKDEQIQRQRAALDKLHTILRESDDSECLNEMKRLAQKSKTVDAFIDKILDLTSRHSPASVEQNEEDAMDEEQVDNDQNSDDERMSEDGEMQNEALNDCGMAVACELQIQQPTNLPVAYAGTGLPTPFPTPMVIPPVPHLVASPEYYKSSCAPDANTYTLSGCDMYGAAVDPEQPLPQGYNWVAANASLQSSDQAILGHFSEYDAHQPLLETDMAMNAHGFPVPFIRFNEMMASY